LLSRLDGRGETEAMMETLKGPVSAGTATPPSPPE
jgi:hypothetical protein